ncbi:2-succinyl-5-enolpyruvyl-6-hydroxy-3-cyclohexene-1-carboxylic-acid synthase [Corynebacterium guangdongense]|uniref:2-succinyl-5-enolpyruvyl-6-hydroxy-3-cyclohexene-1-carboxylate synthase n=1 Tax=Corynebacterium guangdongense TaxID=1783348 RepID=A0ABU1ZW60_9CORY|nr:2-succinyl-5-enolpyruvyl-6-hydroxy-3-cyclohexene-1-carboxylic-acid synthase [Corynebacterium guangdongense]MDR7328467.1 2-succinyl-5-enolpyruvyl-6-hydroxy-3-cyclohexene-1-carboxylate synthase [Corynebacterium guangdongense]WJZ17044.1 2-succinyl-5-enolpyruvyl-6-hydroxy-3-cyclohexene-1-carboxylate synthase [Corynebacterium guangdongense]
MSEPSSPELAAHVADRLAHHVTDVVLCPGSRNSPLSLALLAREDLRVHVRLDERSAAFLALGMARVTGRHVAVVTTSGTAVANCLPAVVESASSHTPLVIVSADRPARFIGTGASQTIDQVGIFGSYADTVQVDADTDFGEAFRATTVHLNVALDTPLVGDALPGRVGGAVRERVDLFVDHGEVAVDLSLDTLVIAGDEAWEVAGLEDVPTIAEPTAPAPFHPVHPLAAGLFARGEISTSRESDYADYVARVRPQQIIIVGHPTLHRPVLQLMAAEDLRVITLSRTADFTDPTGVAVARGTRVRTTGEPETRWMTVCRALSDTAAEAVRTTLDDASLGFTGLHVAAALSDGLGVGDTVVLGASNPVRDASLVGLPYDGVDAYAPRGAAGIDGTVSQAIGVALATQARHAHEIRAPRTVALLGDVTFLHEAGGLLIGPDNPTPENLTIVVANDNGGGIFESLEIGAAPLRDSFERAFGTPHEADLESLVAGYGANYLRAENLRELLEHLTDTTEDPRSITVIEAVTTRATRRELDRALRTAVGL